MPGREEFWNIGYPMFGLLISFAAGISFAMAGYALWRRIRIWKLGAVPVDDLAPWGSRITDFFGYLVNDVLLHRKLIRHEIYPGIMHVAIFWGFLILLVATVLTGLEFYAVEYLDWTLPTARYAAQAGLIWDLGGLLAIVGLGMAAYRRYVVRPGRIPTRFNAGIVLGYLFFLLVTGYLVEGLRIGATELNPASTLYSPETAGWSVVGWAVAKTFDAIGTTPAVLTTLHVSVWWAHALFVLAGIVYMAARFGRLSHIFVSPAHIFHKQRRVRGALLPLGEAGGAGSTGISDLADMSWRQLLSLDACTNCGRCEDQCPARMNGSCLSPRRVVQHMKRFMSERSPVLFGTPDGVALPAPEISVLESVGTEQALWNCTMCAACVEACPVGINHMDLIAGVRRQQVQSRSGDSPISPVTVPASAATGLAEGLTGVRVLETNQRADVLLWVGCNGPAATRERGAEVTEALVSVLRKADVDFAVLGGRESDSGHAARRMGDEHLYVRQAKQNIAALKTADFETIVTNCPHCFNTLKNEYPQLGANFEVRHATEFIADLIDNSELAVPDAVAGGGSASTSGTVVYHDSCALGRYNDIYDAPRRIVNAIPGLKLVEMSSSRDRALCCGCSGCNMSDDEAPGRAQEILKQATELINVRAASSFLHTGADTLVVSGTECLSMFESGLTAVQATDRKSVVDLIELIDRATV